MAKKRRPSSINEKVFSQKGFPYKSIKSHEGLLQKLLQVVLSA